MATWSTSQRKSRYDAATLCAHSRRALHRGVSSLCARALMLGDVQLSVSDGCQISSTTYTVEIKHRDVFPDPIPDVKQLIVEYTASAQGGAGYYLSQQ